MAKFYRANNVIVSTHGEEGVSYDVPMDTEYHVHSLGRGRWYVEREDGYRSILRTAALQRFFSARRYVGDYWSSGEPQYFIRDVYITRA